MESKTDLPITAFKSAKDWSSWLQKESLRSKGIWMKISKKDSEEKTITYAQALEEALCYGWIDGQKKAFDDQAYLQKFCPRGHKVSGLR